MNKAFLEKSSESHFISYVAEESRKKCAAVQMSEFRSKRSSEI